MARAFGLEPRLGAHVRDRHGYLAGKDEDRAADVNGFFADPSVKAILAIQGGWGCARVLPHLDWETIRRQPEGRGPASATSPACTAGCTRRPAS